MILGLIMIFLISWLGFGSEAWFWWPTGQDWGEEAVPGDMNCGADSMNSGR